MLPFIRFIIVVIILLLCIGQGNAEGLRFAVISKCFSPIDGISDYCVASAREEALLCMIAE